MWFLIKCKIDNFLGEYDCFGYFFFWSIWVVLWDLKKIKEEREKFRRNNDMKIQESDEGGIQGVLGLGVGQKWKNEVGKGVCQEERIVYT